MTKYKVEEKACKTSIIPSNGYNSRSNETNGKLVAVLCHQDWDTMEKSME